MSNTTEKKRGRGRPKGATAKPLMELVTERKRLHGNADVFEILCQANIVAEESAELAAQGLRVFNDRNGAVKPLIMWAFKKSIKSKLPTGKTPYTPNNAPSTDLTETSLRFEHKKFKYFVTETVNTNKRQAMWIELLEGIPKNESELLDLVKDKKWPFKSITKEIAQKAFPDVDFD